MKGTKSGKIKYNFWIILSLLFVLYVVFISLNNVILSKLFYIFIFVMAVLGFLGVLISIYVRFKKAKYVVRIKQEKEKNIRDFYRYQKYLDPPDFDLNN